MFNLCLWINIACQYHIKMCLRQLWNFGLIIYSEDWELTNILPVVVWPEISSPAQSLASVINVPSNSCLPRLAFCSFCLGSLGDSSGSLRQHMKANARHNSTMSRPARNVKILDNRKHHHFRILRQSSGDSVVNAIASSSQPDIPFQIKTGNFNTNTSFYINHLTFFLLWSYPWWLVDGWVFLDSGPQNC